METIYLISITTRGTIRVCEENETIQISEDEYNYFNDKEFELDEYNMNWSFNNPNIQPEYERKVNRISYYKGYDFKKWPYSVEVCKFDLPTKDMFQIVFLEHFSCPDEIKTLYSSTRIPEDRIEIKDDIFTYKESVFFQYDDFGDETYLISGYDIENNYGTVNYFNEGWIYTPEYIQSLL